MAALPASCQSLTGPYQSSCSTGDCFSCFTGSCALSPGSNCDFSCSSSNSSFQCTPLALVVPASCQSSYSSLACQFACSKCASSSLGNEIGRPSLSSCDSNQAICSSLLSNTTYDTSSWASLNPGNLTIKYANGSVALGGVVYDFLPLEQRCKSSTTATKNAESATLKPLPFGLVALIGIVLL